MAATRSWPPSRSRHCGNIATASQLPLRPDESQVQQAVEAELARLANSSPFAKFSRRIGHLASGTVVRVIRLVIGLALAALACWCGSVVIDLFSKPIAALTLGNLVQVALALVGTFAAGIGALVVAFGPVEPEPGPRSRIEAAVRERLQQQQTEAVEVAALQSQAAKWYRYGRVVGALFDASLAKRYWWLPIVSVIAAYAVLGFIFAFFSRAH